MPMHLQDWVGQHPYLFWLLLAPLFVAAEALLSGRRPRPSMPGRWLLVVPACVLAAVVAAVAPSLWALQLLICAVAALALHWLLRPRLFPSQR